MLKIEELPPIDRRFAKRLVKIEHEKLAICFASFLARHGEMTGTPEELTHKYIDNISKWAGVETDDQPSATV